MLLLLPPPPPPPGTCTALKSLSAGGNALAALPASLRGCPATSVILPRNRLEAPGLAALGGTDPRSGMRLSHAPLGVWLKVLQGRPPPF